MYSAAVPTPLSYQTPPPRPTAWQTLRRVGVLAGLAVALIQLLVCHLNASAPLRQNFGRDMPLARAAVDQVKLEAGLIGLTGGRPMELHYVERPPSSDTGMTACGLYFGLNYAMFPSRAFVGDGRHVIHDAATLRAADAVPSDAALRARGVAAVVTVGVTPTSLQTAVRPVVAGAAARP